MSPEAACGALAVSGLQRAVQLPDVPTFNELGVKFVDETSWYALFAPKVRQRTSSARSMPMSSASWRGRT
jgi:tripartite-type tricarboxylate transporter receptor subunit TctC